MPHSETIGKIAEALAAAQGEMQNVVNSNTAKVKTKTGADYSYSYSSLGDGIKVCREPLAKHGLAVTQMPIPVDGHPNMLYLETLLIHSSGEWISSTITMTANMANPQEYGSALSYARRYSLFSLLGLATEDDDGAAATKHAQEQKGKGEQKQQATPPPAQPRQTPKASTPPPNQNGDTIAWLQKQSVKAGYASLKDFCGQKEIDFDLLVKTPAMQKSVNTTLKNEIATLEGAFDGDDSSPAPPPLTIDDWWQRLYSVPNLYTVDAATKRKNPSGEWWHMCNRHNLRKEYSQWTPDEIARGIEVIGLYVAELASKAAAEDSDAPPPEITDPFADQQQ